MTALHASRLALLVQLATTLPLVGVIWLVQVVSYPLFLRVGAAEFPAYHAAHARLITFVVGPLMVIELAAALAWAVWPPADVPRWLTAVGLALAVATWVFTFALAVPRHDALSSGFDVGVIESLIAVSWLRTTVWTLRGMLLVWVTRHHG